MLGGAHLTMACPDTLVCRLGDAVGHLHRRLLAADRLGVVVVLDELWALRAHQVWRSACVSLWAWDLLRDAVGPTLVGLSGTFSCGQARGGEGGGRPFCTPACEMPAHARYLPSPLTGAAASGSQRRPRE